MSEQLGEASVLFADVSGSTKLYEIAGDAVAHAAIEQCVNLMREKTLNAKGRVVKTIGDEVMSCFPTADAAADAAIEMQLAIAALPPVGSTRSEFASASTTDRSSSAMATCSATR